MEGDTQAQQQYFEPFYLEERDSLSLSHLILPPLLPLFSAHSLAFLHHVMFRPPQLSFLHTKGLPCLFSSFFPPTSLSSFSRPYSSSSLEGKKSETLFNNHSNCSFGILLLFLWDPSPFFLSFIPFSPSLSSH